jgi:hypothetical protein
VFPVSSPFSLRLYPGPSSTRQDKSKGKRERAKRANNTHYAIKKQSRLNVKCKSRVKPGSRLFPLFRVSARTRDPAPPGGGAAFPRAAPPPRGVQSGVHSFLLRARLIKLPLQRLTHHQTSTLFYSCLDMPLQLVVLLLALAQVAQETNGLPPRAGFGSAPVVWRLDRGSRCRGGPCGW